MIKREDLEKELAGKYNSDYTEGLISHLFENQPIGWGLRRSHIWRRYSWSCSWHKGSSKCHRELVAVLLFALISGVLYIKVYWS